MTDERARFREALADAAMTRLARMLGGRIVHAQRPPRGWDPRKPEIRESKSEHWQDAAPAIDPEDCRVKRRDG